MKFASAIWQVAGTLFLASSLQATADGGARSEPSTAAPGPSQVLRQFCRIFREDEEEELEVLSPSASVLGRPFAACCMAFGRMLDGHFYTWFLWLWLLCQRDSGTLESQQSSLQSCSIDQAWHALGLDSDRAETSWA